VDYPHALAGQVHTVSAISMIRGVAHAEGLSAFEGDAVGVVRSDLPG
jgi:hypothetical protein